MSKLPRSAIASRFMNGGDSLKKRLNTKLQRTVTAEVTRSSVVAIHNISCYWENNGSNESLDLVVLRIRSVAPESYKCGCDCLV